MPTITPDDREGIPGGISEVTLCAITDPPMPGDSFVYLFVYFASGSRIR